MEIDTIGIDLGKTVLHLGLTRAGEVLVRRKFSRTQLLRFTANLRVPLKACKPAEAPTLSVAVCVEAWTRTGY